MEWGPREIKRLWAVEARPCTSHPYLERMGIAEPGNVRVVGDTLLIPMYAFGKGLANLQQVQPDGRIDYVPNAQLMGTVYPFGLESTLFDPGIIYVCEGWLNGWTIHAATRTLVIAVFGQSDLLAVATEIRRLHPTTSIVVAAVNDRWSYHENGEWLMPNPGVGRAIEAAESVGARLAIPDFADLTGRPTDFNALRRREGRQEVLRWLDPGKVPLASTQLEGQDILDRISCARVERPNGASQQRTRIGELLRLVRSAEDEVGALGEAVRLQLRDLGLRVEGGDVFLANTSRWLRRHLASRWSDRQWIPKLRQLDGVVEGPTKYFGASPTSRTTRVPLALFQPLW